MIPNKRQPGVLFPTLVAEISTTVPTIHVVTSPYPLYKNLSKTKSYNVFRLLLPSYYEINQTNNIIKI